MDEKIENNFRYHSPTGDQPEKYEKLRAKGKELAYLMQECCNQGRVLALATTKLEESVMWANASIARGPQKSLPLTERNGQPNG